MSEFTIQESVLWIDTIDQVKFACDVLRDCLRIAIDIEGVNLGRTGRISIIQIATDRKEVFLFDITTLGVKAFNHGLRNILQSNRIQKMIFDCRQDCDALYHLYKVRLNSVHDCQVAMMSIGKFRNWQRLMGLKRALQTSGVIPDEEMQHFNQVKDRGVALFRGNTNENPYAIASPGEEVLTFPLKPTTEFTTPERTPATTASTTDADSTTVTTSESIPEPSDTTQEEIPPPPPPPMTPPNMYCSPYYSTPPSRRTLPASTSAYEIWEKRPLHPELLEYCCLDIQYLLPLYDYAVQQFQRGMNVGKLERLSQTRADHTIELNVPIPDEAKVMRDFQ
jgi:hypothetical protein